MSKDVNQNTPSVDKSESNVNSVQAQGGGELREALDMIIYNLESEYTNSLERVYKGKDTSSESVAAQLDASERALDALQHLITTRLSAQLDSLEAEGPEKRHIPAYDHTTTLNANYGFNAACDQWRTLLAKKRDTL